MNAAMVIGALADEQGSVEVVGSGAIANEIRQLLAERAHATEQCTRPIAIIETTGEATELISALERVADLGTVVLAGPLPHEPLSLDLYTDLHVRGLTLVGIPPGDP